ncbi:SDR family NAD(P)-dependent oxidoreductase [Streptomyces sp. NPDC058375]|uniref:SDR family NAD(P)-dependent oxidoreductase n=1 Tax=Streptomyces sp. NPDC058375 TaxID=3346467 RepID=UPI003650F27D
MSTNSTVRFDGLRALVTGGGTGIGRATAVTLARQGAYVSVAGRTEATLRETIDEIRAEGGQGQAVICDVSDEDSVKNAVSVAAGEQQRLDVAVNSAGVSGGDALRPLADYDTAQFDRMLTVDLRGTFLCMKYELALMADRRSGAIVNVGSGTSLVGVPGFAGYVAAKHGAAGLTKTAALDYGGLGIRVNTVAAGLVETPLVATGRSEETMAARIAQHPLGRIAQAQEIADAIVWLCSGQSSFVTGAIIPVDGGYTVH